MLKSRLTELQDIYKNGYKKLSDLAHPLCQRFGIHGYEFSVVYITGEWHYFSNNYSFNQAQLTNLDENHLYRVYPAYFLPLYTKDRCILWDAEPDNEKEKFNAILGTNIIAAYDYFHTYTVCHKVQTHKGPAIMHSNFYSPKSLQGINRFYINNNKVLTKFNKYVLQEMGEYLVDLPPHESKPEDVPFIKKLINNAFAIDQNVLKFIKETSIHYPKFNQLINMRLSTRQEELVHWMLYGKSESQMAEILGLSLHTVRTYVARLKKKFGCYSKTELLLKLVDAELISDDDWSCLY